MIQLDYTHAAPFLPPDWQERYLPRLTEAESRLEAGTGAGAAYTGWLRLPQEYDREELSRVRAAAARIRADCQAFVVVGIGGSYLGARGAIDLLCSPDYNLSPNGGPQIFFAGNSLSSDAAAQLLTRLEGLDFAVSVISKSGTTTEPAIAFRLLRGLLERKYGTDGARRRIIATTDPARGALKAMAEQEGYERFVIPENIGGRYSVLTAVGLLPMAVAGIDVDAVLAGAEQEMSALLAERSMENPAWRYAAARNALYESGKQVEALACYEPSFRFFAEWWKQLYGESEGKNRKGIFPASVEFTADLHSMGQYFQEGRRILFETVVRFQKSRVSLLIPRKEDDADGLNFLAGQTLEFAARQAMDGTLLAHVDGGVPNLILRVPGMDAASFGAMVYFFERACALSGYLLDVNPFDQPGVEEYKRNMFALLGKPGYSQLRADLLQKMGHIDS